MTMRRGALRVLVFTTSLSTLMLCASASAQEMSPRTVLAIHLGAENYPSNPVLDKSIRDALATRQDVPIDYFTEYLESDLFPGRDHELAFSDYLRRKYRGRKIDLVIAIANAALQFVMDHRAQLFPGAPVIFVISGAPDDITRPLDADLTGIQVEAAYSATLALALELHPATEQVFIVANQPDSQPADVVRAELGDSSKRVRLTYIREPTVPRLLAAVRAIPPRSVVLYIWHSQEHPGNILYPPEIARLVAEAARVPVYGTSDLYLGTGVVGGVVRSTSETGTRIGAMAIRMLTGTPARDIPIERAKVAPFFDWRAMRRWGVDERRLPPDSVVLFRGPNLWRDYRREVLTGIGVLAFQSLLILGLLYERRARRKAEVESRNSLALAADANRRVTMSALTGSIAHELSQPLNSILHNAQAGEMMVDSNRATLETVRQLLSEIRSADVRATQIIERHRTMMRTRKLEKKPVDIQSVVRESLALVAHNTRANQIQVEVDLPTDPCVVAGDSVLLQQVFVNLVMNATEAMREIPRDRRCVTVLGMLTQGSVEVSVRDTGTGLPVNIDRRLFTPFVTTKANGVGIGLTIARSITEAHGGRMEAHNNPEGGATFTLTLPCVSSNGTGSSAVARPS